MRQQGRLDREIPPGPSNVVLKPRASKGEEREFVGHVHEDEVLRWGRNEAPSLPAQRPLEFGPLEGSLGEELETRCYAPDHVADEMGRSDVEGNSFTVTRQFDGLDARRRPRCPVLESPQLANGQEDLSALLQPEDAGEAIPVPSFRRPSRVELRRDLGIRAKPDSSATRSEARDDFLGMGGRADCKDVPQGLHASTRAAGTLEAGTMRVGDDAGLHHPVDEFPFDRGKAGLSLRPMKPLRQVCHLECPSHGEG